MSQDKTVVLFVRHYNDYEGINHVFIETCEVGFGLHYATPSEFINAMSKTYLGVGDGTVFRIENVVIG